jgi:hypothetical protein
MVDLANVLYDRSAAVFLCQDPMPSQTSERRRDPQSVCWQVGASDGPVLNEALLDVEAGVVAMFESDREDVEDAGADIMQHCSR